MNDPPRSDRPRTWPSARGRPAGPSGPAAGVPVSPVDRGSPLLHRLPTGTPARIAPISRTVASGSMMCCVHHQAPFTTRARRSLSLPPCRGSRPGVAPRGIGRGPGMERVFVNAADEARTIGARLRQIRHARRKSLRVSAGLAGMSKSRLSQIERGGCALDRRSDILALADALQIAPSRCSETLRPRGARPAAHPLAPGCGRSGAARYGLPGGSSGVAHSGWRPPKWTPAAGDRSRAMGPSTRC
jgi:transcriptional regulator with XRE-family HTH domain